MNYILFDDESWHNLLPLTYTKPQSEIRIGILTITEKWNTRLKTSCSFATQDYLKEKYSIKTEAHNMLINGSICPNDELISAISSLKLGERLVQESIVIAANINATDIPGFLHDSTSFSAIPYTSNVLKISFPWDIFRNNGSEIETDFEIITKGRASQPLGETNKVLCPEKIFIEEGASVLCATLNASSGSIYIGKHAEIMEGSLVRGPFALCEHSALKMAAKIYGPTTIGPHSKIGGEINNSVVFGFSNKAHDGFLGNSVIGEWCNLGADTNNSNLKNNYQEVALWNYPSEKMIKTGLQFCGLIMGDHSKCGINTMFNTGTVVGVCSNIFGAGFPRNFIPSFYWGGPHGFQVYKADKAFETAEKVMSRRDIKLTQIDKNILTNIFEFDRKWRTA